MKSLRRNAGKFALFIFSIILLVTWAAWAGSRSVIVLEIDGPIGPATDDYLQRALDAAAEQQVQAVILQMDTPGGLDTSMRRIIKRITMSKVPIVGYVAPSGARAASAGTYIMYASHIAAMAPGTNLGAATPIQIGGLPSAEKEDEDESVTEGKEDATTGGDPKNKKLVNDAAAYLRSLAQMRGRNMDWAEEAVREAVSLPAEEALAIGVIDLIASDLQDLLSQINGRTVTVAGIERLIDTEGALLERIEPDWRNRLLAVISNPNVAYVLMLIGIYGLIYEFSNPGMLVAGTVGAICLLLALFAFQALPISYAGMALILFGLALIIAEAFVPSFGALGIGGVVAFIIGSVILIDTEAPGWGISLSLILSFAIASALVLMAVISLAIKSRRRPIVSGGEQLIGERGYAIKGFSHTGMVRVHGEIWEALTDESVDENQSVQVIDRKGLTLVVTPEHMKKG